MCEIFNDCFYSFNYEESFDEANLRLRVSFNLRDASHEIEDIICKIRLNSLYECHYRLVRGVLNIDLTSHATQPWH